MKELVELKQAAFELSKVVASLGDSLDLPKVDAEIASLEEQQNADGFWNDQKKAKTVTSRLAYLTNKKNALKKIQSDYQDIEGMLPEVSEGDKDMLELLTSMEEDLEKACSTLRHQLLFSGEYDGLNCTLEIHPGAGGTEAQDCACIAASPSATASNAKCSITKKAKKRASNPRPSNSLAQMPMAC